MDLEQTFCENQSGTFFRSERNFSGDKRFRNGFSNREGISLLEIILAIAILGVAMAAISQLINIGHQSAVDARDFTEAQILCDAKISEVAAGVIPTSSVQGASIAEAPGWTYSLTIEPAGLDGLFKVDCVVQKDSEYLPVAYRLVRWIPDPDYEAELKDLDEAEDAENE